jgi:hypothetical protein
MFSRRNTQSKLTPRALSAIDRLLIAGIKVGPATKRDTVNKVLKLVPEWKRGDCWQRIRLLRRTGKIETSQHPSPADGEKYANSERRVISRRPWTAADDDRLLTWVGYEPVDKIAQRLSRSAKAVRCRLCALGMSARVTDGWSLRALRKLLRVSPVRLRQFIGTGMLRVRDPRITAKSLVAFCKGNCTSLNPADVSRIATGTSARKEAYTWERVADLLGVDLRQVQSWISAGHLKVMDSFVTDRSFEEFVKKHSSESNLNLIDPAVRKWLVQEYGLTSGQSNGCNVPRAQKHALTVRTCKCGRTIAGNVYFRHRKSCKVAQSQGTGLETTKYKDW